MMRILVFLALMAPVNGCKKREDAAGLRDIVAYGEGLTPILYYRDGRDAFRAECKGLPENVNPGSFVGFSLRNTCKSDSRSLGEGEFRINLLSHITQVGHSPSQPLSEEALLRRLSLEERSAFAYFWDILRTGPNPDLKKARLESLANPYDRARMVFPYDGLVGDKTELLRVLMLCLDKAFYGPFIEEDPGANKPRISPFASYRIDRAGGEPIEIETRTRPSKRIKYHWVPEDELVNVTARLAEPVSLQEEEGFHLSIERSDARGAGEACPFQVMDIQALFSLDAARPVSLTRRAQVYFVEGSGLDSGKPIDRLRLSFYLPHGMEKEITCSLAFSKVTFPKGQVRIDPSFGRPNLGNRDGIMRKVMGARSMRKTHFMWHAVRNIWTRPEGIGIRGQLARIGWQIPNGPNGRPRAVYYNPDGSPNLRATWESGAGEDFLYMHRSMIEKLYSALGDYAMYTPWHRLPFPDEQPVPYDPSFFDKTSAGFARMQRWLHRFMDPRYLATIKSLSELGVKIEFTIHNAMHIRWSRPIDYTPQTHPLQRYFEIESGAEDRRRGADDNLLDSYTSHANPLFWRLHGWVDGRIDAWLKVHGYSLQSSCPPGDKQCLSWQGTWLGPERLVAAMDHRGEVMQAGGFKGVMHQGMKIDDIIQHAEQMDEAALEELKPLETLDEATRQALLSARFMSTTDPKNLGPDTPTGRALEEALK